MYWENFLNDAKVQGSVKKLSKWFLQKKKDFGNLNIHEEEEKISILF